MLFQRLLQELDRTAGVVAQAIHVVQADARSAAAGEAAATALLQNLHYVERHIGRFAGAALRRPIPLPREDAVGAWAGEMMRLPNLPDLTVPDDLPGMVGRLLHQANAVGQWAEAVQRGSPSPAAGPTAGADGAASPPAVGPSNGVKVLGWVLTGLSLAGGLATVIAMTAADRKRVLNFGVDPDHLTPQDAEREAQALLDHEIPGAQARVMKTPSGRWLASVRKGTEMYAREESHDPAKAAGQAVQVAVDYDLARRERLEPARVVASGGPAGTS